MMIGSVLNDRYEIVSQLGAGGMAAVWLANDKTLNRQVALKTILLANRNANAHRQRFQREAKVCASVSHKNVISILDFGTLKSGELFYTMDYLPYPDLQQLINRSESFPEERTLTIMGGLADALIACHAKGLIHRDIKASNVIIKGYDEAILSDFGLVYAEDKTRLTATGMFVGTPMSAPPETFISEEVDPRSDIFQLGLIFYELIAGQPLYQSVGVHVHLVRLSDPEFDPAAEMNLAEDCKWEKFLKRCLARDLDVRFPSAKALKDALEGRPSKPSSQKRERGKHRAVPKLVELKSETPLSAATKYLLPLLVVVFIASLFLYFKGGSSEKLWTVEELKIVPSARGFSAKWRSEEKYPTMVKIEGNGKELSSSVSSPSTKVHVLTLQGLQPGTEYTMKVVFPGGKSSWPHEFTTLVKDSLSFEEVLAQFIEVQNNDNAYALRRLAKQSDVNEFIGGMSKAVDELCLKPIEERPLDFETTSEVSAKAYMSVLEILLSVSQSKSMSPASMKGHSQFLLSSFRFFKAFYTTEDFVRRQEKNKKKFNIDSFVAAGRLRYFKLSTLAYKRVSAWLQKQEKKPPTFIALQAWLAKAVRSRGKAVEKSRKAREQLLQNYRGNGFAAPVIALLFYVESTIYNRNRELKKLTDLIDEFLVSVPYFPQKEPIYEETMINWFVLETVCECSRLMVSLKEELSEEAIIEHHVALTKSLDQTPYQEHVIDSFKSAGMFPPSMLKKLLSRLKEIE